ncbi:hypothetical protein ABTA53_18945, partial [Acinetobacter baumannii]
RGLLPAFLDRADQVWLADSRVKGLTAPDYAKTDTVLSETRPDLNEFDEFRHVNIYHGQRSGISGHAC